MSARFLAALLCLAWLGTGCIYVDDPTPTPTPTPARGDVDFLWTFDGRPCATVRDLVAGVRVTIPGSPLANTVDSPCNANGVDGLGLQNFAPGSYVFSLEAYNEDNQVVFSGSGNFTVDGDVTVRVDLAPRGTANSFVYASWRFPNNMSCAQASVESVDVSIDGGAWMRLPCSVGSGGQVARSPALTPGQHTLQVVAVGFDGKPRYSDSDTVTTAAYAAVSVEFVFYAPSIGDVDFLWTFDGRSCATVRDFVQSVRITIPGQTLANNGYFPCSTSGVDGIRLLDFAPGSYGFTLEAYNANNQVVFSRSGNFTVDGDVTLRVNLAPTGTASSFAYVSWRFPSNISCAQASVESVDVSIDGGAWTRLSCTAGSGGQAVRSPPLAPGQHTLQLVAVGSDGNSRYYASGILNTVAYESISATFAFGEVGGLALRWDLLENSLYRTCAQAGVTQVAIHLYEHATGKYIYGNTGDVHGCGDAPVAYRLLTPGEYTVIIRGTGPSAFYTNEFDNPPKLTVYPFVHPQTSTTLNLRKQ
jgi:hypothetical protein